VKSTNPRLSAKSVEWFTPGGIVEAARAVMGDIDLDPASCAQANETVRALQYYSSDGLTQQWSGRVFCNPPGGRGVVTAFWSKLCGAWQSGAVTQAIWIGYSLEQLQTLQRFTPSPLSGDFCLCFPHRRIAFDSPGGGKRSPTHGNYIAYLPPRDDGRGVSRFYAFFATYGELR